MHECCVILYFEHYLYSNLWDVSSTKYEFNFQGLEIF